MTIFPLLNIVTSTVKKVDFIVQPKEDIIVPKPFNTYVGRVVVNTI